MIAAATEKQDLEIVPVGRTSLYRRMTDEQHAKPRLSQERCSRSAP